jgi:hypothetical protein
MSAWGYPPFEFGYTYKKEPEGLKNLLCRGNPMLIGVGAWIRSCRGDAPRASCFNALQESRNWLRTAILASQLPGLTQANRPSAALLSLFWSHATD